MFRHFQADLGLGRGNIQELTTAGTGRGNTCFVYRMRDEDDLAFAALFWAIVVVSIYAHSRKLIT